MSLKTANRQVIPSDKTRCYLHTLHKEIHHLLEYYATLYMYMCIYMYDL
jgi:hypothetical protein